MLGKTEGRRRRGWQRMRCLYGITDSMDMNLGEFQEMVRDREAWSGIVHEIAKSLAAEQQQLPHLSMPAMFLPSLSYSPHPCAMTTAPGTGARTHILQNSNAKGVSLQRSEAHEDQTEREQKEAACIQPTASTFFLCSFISDHPTFHQAHDSSLSQVHTNFCLWMLTWPPWPTWT